jgi:hypothetical protein
MYRTVCGNYMYRTVCGNYMYRTVCGNYMYRTVCCDVGNVILPAELLWISCDGELQIEDRSVNVFIKMRRGKIH